MKKYYRVEIDNVDTNKIYDTNNSNYGINFNYKGYQHFLDSYYKLMESNNISVDFIVSVNNQIYSQGENYLSILQSAVKGNIINIFDVTMNNNHKGQQLNFSDLYDFLQSFDENNQFIKFDKGIYLWEYMLEEVRNNHFNNLPKRLSSKFLFKDIKSCEYYKKQHLNGNGIIYEIEIIQSREYHEADMKIIDNITNHILYKDLKNEFEDYWNKKKTSSPITEIIFQGKYKYIKKVV